VFRADPFGIEVEDFYYLFYEEYNKITAYGTINCMVLNKQFDILDDKVVIDESIHFSYPYIFRYQGDFYILPETYKKNELAIYKAINFPFDWKREKCLLKEPCMDSVLFFKDNMWWLIYSKFDYNADNYFIRSNKNFIEGWEDCREYEISGSRYNSRCGGSIFENEETLYRVTQNCTDFYGQSVVINKINILSLPEYSETPVREININKGIVAGFHTISSCSQIVFIDRRRRRLFLKPISKMIYSVFKKAISLFSHGNNLLKTHE
jgi:hypothetical protein